MDKFEDIQAFVAVVEAGSFTAAADRLGSAKSAVSRRISALEERLGVQLLRRMVGFSSAILSFML